MTGLTRVLAKFVNVPQPLPAADLAALTPMLATPANIGLVHALIAAAANPLVPLVTTSAQLRNLVQTVRSPATGVDPSVMVATLVAINALSPGSLSAAGRDIVLHFQVANNFVSFPDPAQQKLMTALNAALPASAAVLNWIQNHTWNEFRILLRGVQEPYLGDALTIMQRFLAAPGTHAGQITAAQLPLWAKVHSYCPPNGAVTATITFNPNLLADHIRKHVLYEYVHGVRSPDPEERHRFFLLLNYREQITPGWLARFYPHATHAILFRQPGHGSALMPHIVNTTLPARNYFFDLLDRSARMRAALLLLVQNDYEQVAIRAVRHGQKFVHYAPAGNQIFITGRSMINGVYVMARFVEAPIPTIHTGDFAISTAYLPSAADLLAQLATWVPSTVWNLA